MVKLHKYRRQYTTNLTDCGHSFISDLSIIYTKKRCHICPGYIPLSVISGSAGITSGLKLMKTVHASF